MAVEYGASREKSGLEKRVEEATEGGFSSSDAPNVMEAIVGMGPLSAGLLTGRIRRVTLPGSLPDSLKTSLLEYRRFTNRSRRR